MGKQTRPLLLGAEELDEGVTWGQRKREKDAVLHAEQKRASNVSPLLRVCRNGGPTEIAAAKSGGGDPSEKKWGPSCGKALKYI